MPQIVVENLVKTFHIAQPDPGMGGALKGLVSRRKRVVKALDGVTFSIDAGELVGYIGPNGAGKSTTIKVLSGIMVPDSGVCRALDLVPWQQRQKYVARIGVVFGQRTQLWWDLPVVESFELLRDIYRVDRNAYSRTRDELIDLLTLSPLLDVPVRQLSLGQRMRCDLAASLLHSPRIVFLDEPTIGLDATSKLAVRDFVKRLNAEKGVTVILTTHDFDDIEALCSRLIVIGGGRVLADGGLETLRRQVAPDRWLIADFDTAPAAIDDPDVTVVATDGCRVTLSFDPERVPTAALIGRLASRYPVRDLFVQNPPIESMVARLYGEHA